MKAGKFLKYLVLFVVAINLMIIAAMFLGSAAETKPVPMPNPNGYDDFVRAEKAVVGSDFSYTNQTREELAKIVLANTEALKLVHEGVTKECMVPQNYSAAEVQRLLGELSAFKSLASLQRMEGKLAELNGKTNEAVKNYLEGVRFADDSSRGGLVINKLIGIACEAIAMKSLNTLKPGLDSEQCARIGGVLEEIDTHADPVENIIEREENFSRKTGGVRGQLTALVMYKYLRNVNKAAADKIDANTLRRRQAMISFAGRAYELEKGKPPASIADLVPAFLKNIPQDPVTKTNLAYVP